ncbi:hypothetical protein BS47DRAFT_1388425 [Hydnum rufescens UP504]|uniref:Secreted protein n=1 Tax=Hydnum rufescens UP504 TaxID=1448309 RepID=A0A9P6B768_9AGAM|nr:hypothetical protein BS47DRAFT_1388425 [Hydnum rufescens UP504]
MPGTLQCLHGALLLILNVNMSLGLRSEHHVDPSPCIQDLHEARASSSSVVMYKRKCHRRLKERAFKPRLVHATIPSKASKLELEPANLPCRVQGQPVNAV